MNSAVQAEVDGAQFSFPAMEQASAQAAAQVQTPRPASARSTLIDLMDLME